MSKIILKHGSGTPPTLDTGEAGFDTTNHILYVGDGSTNTAIGDVDLSNINTELLTVGSYGSTPLYSDDWITIGGGDISIYGQQNHYINMRFSSGISYEPEIVGLRFGDDYNSWVNQFGGNLVASSFWGQTWIADSYGGYGVDFLWQRGPANSPTELMRLSLIGDLSILGIYSSGGIAGVSGTYSNPTSITVTGGIITSIS